MAEAPSRNEAPLVIASRTAALSPSKPMTRRPRVVEFRYLLGRLPSPDFRSESVSPRFFGELGPDVPPRVLLCYAKSLRQTPAGRNRRTRIEIWDL